LIEDVFELQDKVASSVAGVIEPALEAAEIARSAGRPTNDLTAYDLYLRGRAVYLSSRKRKPEALALLEQAIERDPHYGPPLALSAVCLAQRCVDGWSNDPEADSRKGTDFARRALQVARDDPNLLASAAMALAYFGEDIGAMMALWAGQPDRAIEHAEVALRLNPRGIVRSSNMIGAAHLVSGRFDEAVPKLLLAIQEDPAHPTPYRNLAACYAHMGRLVQAQEIIARLRAITPVVAASANYFRNTKHREIFLSGLRLAAGETA
jgi:adenylate cyclase